MCKTITRLKREKVQGIYASFYTEFVVLNKIKHFYDFFCIVILLHNFSNDQVRLNVYCHLIAKFGLKTQRQQG